jgi:nucleotide-binding universal stress UspA family protein
MSVKTIFVGPCFGSHLDSTGPSESLVDYAAGLAASKVAHLSVGLGVFDVVVHSAILARLQEVVDSYNQELRGKAKTFADALTPSLCASGVVAEIEIVQGAFTSVAQRVVQMARVTDVAILEPNNEAFSLQEGLVEEVLFGSGRPVIAVPKKWVGRASPERIIVAWDGGAKAARAIGDALPFLEAAQEVEVVSVSGDANSAKRLDGAEIAPHLARHCRSVKVTQLASTDGDIAATLGGHARLIGADLLVMGAYGHAKVIELILGGVTRSMIFEPPIPVFMSC